MTKQEAIEILRDTPIDIRCTREDDIHTLYATAQGMAIEALQHDCEKVAESCDDYITIKRQFVQDAIAIGLSGYITDDDKLTLEGMGIAVSELPSAQPEIVRCKDCKHYYYADNRIPQEQRYSCDLDGDRWKPEDFCSYAERKDNG